MGETFSEVGWHFQNPPLFSPPKKKPKKHVAVKDPGKDPCLAILCDLLGWLSDHLNG